MKYTYSDEEEEEGYSDSTNRRSTRYTGTHTPAETGPTVTQSGRQVRSRQGGTYGESMLSGRQTPAVVDGAHDGTEENTEGDDESVGRRPRRGAAASNSTNGRVAKGGRHIEGYNSVDELSDEEDASEQDYGDDEEDDDHLSVASDDDEKDEASDEEEVEDELDLDDATQEKKKLVVKLTVKTPTPERKNTTRLSHTSDEKLGELAEPATETPTANEATDQAVPGSVSLPSVTDSTAKVNGDMKVAKPIPQSKPETSKLASHSPSLTFRGSPEKPQPSFSPASINVSQNGS